MRHVFCVDGTDEDYGDSGIITFNPEAVVIAGFTGRDRAGVEAHLAELAELGVPVPEAVPAFYLTPGDSAVQGERIEVLSAETSGEAEAVLIFDHDRTYLTLGSDHTDRAAEAIDIPLSKLACPKPLADTGWPLEDVIDHADRLEIRSWIGDDDGSDDDGYDAGSDGGGVGPTPTLYQHGTLGELLAIDDLLAAVPFANRPERFVLFTGTFPAIGGIRPARSFRASLDDPVTGRSITLEYRTEVLNVLQPPA